MMKKMITLVIMGVVLLLAGCDSQTGVRNEVNKTSSAGTTKTMIEGRKVLIAYYSLTNTTARAARSIHDKIGGDLFEIQAENPYPTDHDACLERDMQEIKDNARPAVANRVENMSQYDVVFIGYPIWYYQAPMIINTFLESYNLQGKTIVPFCTSGGYPIDNSIELLKGSIPNANIAEGHRIDNESDMMAWLKRLGFSGSKRE